MCLSIIKGKKVFSFSLSSVLLVIVLFSLMCIISQDKRWIKEDIISQDTNFYYIYLPATFIYHDLTYNYISDTVHKLTKKARDHSWTLMTTDWHRVSKMPGGYALMHLPFFLIAHSYVVLKGKIADGYSDPTYSKFIFISAFFYFMLALIYQRKILLCFFSEGATAITLIVLALGTNIYYYVVYSPGMAHVYGFCLFSLLIWNTIKWHEQATAKRSMAIGLLLGLITMVRASNILFALFPLLYGVYSIEALRKKLALINQNKSQIILTLAFFLFSFIPQLIIWKIQTGHFFYYSYQSERFYFNHPHILEGLFGFRKGLFIYTPVMMLAMAGFITVIRRKQPYGFAALFFFIVNCFVVFSWWCWWYGGSFGMRAMIESYAILSLPLTAFINEIISRKLWMKIMLYIILIFFTALNIFQTVQSHSTLLHYDSMTVETYKKIFGHLTFPPGYDETLCTPDYEFASLGKPERNLNAGQFPFLHNRREAIVLIKASNGKYVSADKDFNRALVADRSSGWEWEHFRFVALEDGKCCFISWQNKFVTADLDHNAEIVANRNYAGAWEKFEIIRNGDNKYSFKAINQKFIKYNDDNLKLEAVSDKISDKEIFEIVVN